MLIYTAGFYGIVLFGCHRVDLPVSGKFAIFQSMAKVTIHAYFLPSYYYAIGAGIVCLLSSLTHGWTSIRFYRRNRGIEKGEGNGL